MDDRDDQALAGEDGTPPEQSEEWFAANLRAVRESKGLSQTWLADEMSGRGWPWRQQTVARIENGQRTVRLGEAKTVADILRVPLDRLTWSGPEVTATTMVHNTIGNLRLSWSRVADAVAELRAAQFSADRTLKESHDSPYQRVQDARRGLEEEMADAGLDDAIAEGEARWRKMKAGG